MFKGLCRKFYALLRKEAVHENEPQRILFLLRIILLILGLYFLIIPYSALWDRRQRSGQDIFSQQWRLLLFMQHTG